MSKLFLFCIVLHPKEKNESAKVIVDLKTILARDAETAKMSATLQIPEEHKGAIDNIEIFVRPF